MIPIVSGILGLATAGVDVWKSKAEAKAKLTQAEAEARSHAMIKALEHESNWELIHAQNSATSWKDEYWTIVISLPAFMCFLGFDEEVRAGFAALETAPEWYQYLLVAIALAAFGLRGLNKFTKR